MIRGINIGNCVDDRFFVGTCCKIPSKDAQGDRNSTKSGADFDNRKRVAIEQNHDQRVPGMNEDLHDQRTPPKIEADFDSRKPVAIEQNHDQHVPRMNEDSHVQCIPVMNEDLHDQSVPVRSEDSHDQHVLVRNEDAYDQRAPVRNEDSHDQRLPVRNEDSHDQRLPVRNEDAHDQRVPVMNEDSHDQRTPPKIEEDFDNRKPVVLEDDHDQSIPVMNEEFHDQRFPTKLQIPAINKSNCSTLPIHENTTLLPDVGKVCGRPVQSITKRIAGGRRSKHIRWPWMISLRLNDGETFKHKCGATLLNQFWAATAAHCVDGKHMKDIILLLGGDQKLGKKYRYIERGVCEMVIHPQFESSTYENDIALLRFENPVAYQVNIIPVCLPYSIEDITGRMAVVTGWGKLDEKGDFPATLHEVYVPIISNSACEQMYHESGYRGQIRKTFVCAGDENGGFDACEGDSGGPMIIKGERGQWVLVGLISWGMSCAEPKQPGVYIRISEFKNWIIEIIDH